MMAELLDLVRAEREIAKLKSLVTAKQELVDIAEKNAELAEKGIKDALKTVQTKTLVKDRVMYVNSRKLERFRGKPEKLGDLPVEDWVEDAKAACASRGFSPREQAAFLMEHLAGSARREVIGRGQEVMGDPEKIYMVLTRVFGDGDSLPQLQQLFYSYRQKEGDDLVTCSLDLVKLFDRIAQLDVSFTAGRDIQLKNRLAEAVREEKLRTELRRLNSDYPEISFFDARDRVIQLMRSQDSLKPPRQETTINEVSVDHDLSQKYAMVNQLHI